MSDNTFATARDIGSFGASGGSILARGRIGRFDPVDVYRFKVRGGSSFSVRTSTLIRGGNLDVSVYYRNSLTNRIIQASRQTLFPNSGTATTTFPAFPAGQAVTLYLRFDQPTQNVNYRVSYTSLST